MASKIFWRESNIDFGSLDALIRSLERRPARRELAAAPISEDLAALRTLAVAPEIAGHASSPAALRLLWDVCQVPDYRNHGRRTHAHAVANISASIERRSSDPNRLVGGTS